MSKNKDCLAWNQDNVPKWSDMSTSICRLLFQSASSIKLQLRLLFWYMYKSDMISSHEL